MDRLLLFHLSTHNVFDGLLARVSIYSLSLKWYRNCCLLCSIVNMFDLAYVLRHSYSPESRHSMASLVSLPIYTGPADSSSLTIHQVLIPTDFICHIHCGISTSEAFYLGFVFLAQMAAEHGGERLMVKESSCRYILFRGRPCQHTSPICRVTSFSASRRTLGFETVSIQTRKNTGISQVLDR
jgi:hypothetical protein